jgi:hypothetical protein
MTTGNPGYSPGFLFSAAPSFDKTPSHPLVDKRTELHFGKSTPKEEFGGWFQKLPLVITVPPPAKKNRL